MRIRISIVCLASVLAVLQALAGHGQQATRIESYLSACELRLQRLCSRESLPSFASGDKYIAAVISFDLDNLGHLRHLHIRHRSGDDDLDRNLLQLMKRASPLPPPPSQLGCPRHMAAVFDNSRYHPARLLFDENVPPSIHMEMPN